MTTIINPLPNTFVNGTVVDGPAFNTNFAQIVDNVNTNAAGSGANDDITSLSALTTPIPPVAGGMPTGAMLAFGSVTPPSGWLLCDATAVSRTTYAALFAVVGTSFGIGDGTTTFNVPDMRGRVAAGYDAANASGRLTAAETGGASAAAIANSGGEQGHVLVTGELASHNHGVTDPGHNHGVTDPGHQHAPETGQFLTNNNGAFNITEGGGGLIDSNSFTASATTGVTVNSNTTGITTGNAGSGSSHNNVQPTLVVPWIIKT